MTAVPIRHVHVAPRAMTTMMTTAALHLAHGHAKTTMAIGADGMETPAAIPKQRVVVGRIAMIAATAVASQPAEVMTAAAGAMMMTTIAVRALVHEAARAMMRKMVADGLAIQKAMPKQRAAAGRAVTTAEAAGRGAEAVGADATMTMTVARLVRAAHATMVMADGLAIPAAMPKRRAAAGRTANASDWRRAAAPPITPSSKSYNRVG